MGKLIGQILWIALTILSASNAVAADATLSWTAPGNDGTVGQAATYDIRYSVTPITDANWGQATHVLNPPVPKPSGSKELFKVSGLQSATTYYFAMKAADSKPNWSKLSNIAVKKTCTGSCIGFTGNVDGSIDGIVDVRDLSTLVIYLTNPQALGTFSICPEQANVNGSADGVVDVSDLSRLMAYLTSGTPLAPCR
jgi:hypothetical protein